MGELNISPWCGWSWRANVAVPGWGSLFGHLGLDGQFKETGFRSRPGWSICGYEHRLGFTVGGLADLTRSDRELVFGHVRSHSQSIKRASAVQHSPSELPCRLPSTCTAAGWWPSKTASLPYEDFREDTFTVPLFNERKRKEMKMLHPRAMAFWKGQLYHNSKQALRVWSTNSQGHTGPDPAIGFRFLGLSSHSWCRTIHNSRGIKWWIALCEERCIQCWSG